MYFYQLMLAKDWQQLKDNIFLSVAQRTRFYSPIPKRIKYFYDNEYNDIVKQLVNEPESCKHFYPVLQQVGLPYQSYYHKSADKVAKVLTTALYEEKVVLIHQPQMSGYHDFTPSVNGAIKSVQVIKKEPMYEPDDSWLIVELVNHRPELIQIHDANSNNVVTSVQTSANEIFLKHSDVFSSTQVLPKVHILLGGLQGNYDLALRGEKPLRVKLLAQSWLDELSKLLRSGNSPFTIEQDEALASQINYGFSAQHYYQTKQIDDKSAFRPDETIGVFFYQMLVLLNKTDFITPKQRIGDCSSHESEAAIPDVKLLKLALKSLHNIRHSEGQDKADYAYHSNKLVLTANEYLNKPLALDGTGHENDYETLLKHEISHYTQLDQLTDIEQLYFNAIKLLKCLREPGIIRNVETRREYQLKATKLDYSYVELKPSEGFYIEFHKDHKYEVKSISTQNSFVGRFNPQHRADIKIPHKWANIDDWRLETTAIDTNFIEEYFGDLDLHRVSNANSGAKIGSIFGTTGTIVGGVTGYLYGNEIKSEYIEYENQILGGAQVLGGVLTLVAAGAIEGGSLGTGTAFAVALGFIGADNIAAGLSRMATDKEVTTLGEDIIEWSGLVPKGYEGITYGMIDLTLGGKVIALSKLPSVTKNVVSIQIATQLGQKTASLKDVKILIANLSKNSKNQYHLLRYQVYSPKKLNYQTTSGVILIADSNRVTTILGRYVDDTGAIISELKLPKLMKFDIKNGKFNLLNVKDGLYKTPEQFWQQYNKPWLDKVIARDDIILLATKPEPKYLYIMDEAKTVKELTGFGREYHYLLEHGYKFDKATMQMIKGQ